MRRSRCLIHGRRAASALAVLAALAGCGEAPGKVAAVGSPAPAYAAPTLEGDTLSLAELRGQVVLLNIWATWCPPCREEMPALEALQREYRDQGLRVVGVSIDTPSAAGDVRSFVEQHGLTFTILHDAQEQATRTFRTAGVPESYLIGRDGTLLKRWIGMIQPDAPGVRDPIRAALAEPAT